MKEDQSVEYKEQWRGEYLKWICGFANANGGSLYIGKNDRGEVTGLPGASILLETIPNKVRDILGILVDVNLLKQADKDYLEILVDPYPYPISYQGQYHYRSGSTKQELKGAALDRFLLQKQGTVEKTVEKSSSILLIQILKENPGTTIKELQTKLALSRRGVEWNLNKLKTENKIERIGPDKGGYWKVNDSNENSRE